MKIQFCRIDELGVLSEIPFEIIKFDENLLKAHVIQNMPKILSFVLIVFHTCKRIITTQDHALFYVVISLKECIIRLKIHSLYEKKK